MQSELTICKTVQTAEDCDFALVYRTISWQPNSGLCVIFLLGILLILSPNAAPFAKLTSFGFSNQPLKIAQLKKIPNWCRAMRLRFIVIIFGLILSAFLEIAFVWVGWSIVVIVLFAVFIHRLNQIFPACTKILFGPILYKTLVLLSLIPISFGYYVYELGIVGQTQVHAGYFACLSVLLLLTSCLTHQLLESNIAANNKFEPTKFAKSFFYSITLVLIIFSIVYLWDVGRTSGFAIFEKIDRFEFRAGQSWLFSIIITYKPVFAGMMGVVRFRLKPNRLAALVLDISISVFIVMTMLFGEKFLSIIVVTGYYFLPYFIVQPNRPKLNRVSLAVVAILAVGVSAATWNIYSDYGSLDSTATMQRLMYRFTGQGELWFIASAQTNSIIEIDRMQTDRLFDVMASKNANDEAFKKHVGIFYLVEKFGERNISEQLLGSTGLVQFTGGFEPYFMTIWGYLPMVLVIISAGVLGGACAFFLQRSAKNGDVFSTFSATYLMVAFTSAINQSSIWQLIGFSALKYASLLIVFAYISKKLFLKTLPDANAYRV